MKKEIFKTNAGYTIIETMIAVSLFLVIVLYGITSLMNASLLQKKSESMRSMFDNLSFVMEEVSRNLRMGSAYDCLSYDEAGVDLLGYDCDLGSGISFKLEEDTWIYYISDGSLKKSTDGGTTFVSLTSPEVIISPDSGFSVLGAEIPMDKSQPLARITLEGKISTKELDTSFSLQTLISQRKLDIP